MLLPLAAPILHTTLARRPPDRQGKVRDIYDLGDQLLIVATDRISAFDYVLGSGIPDKGKVLSQISAFWFDRTLAIVPNHVLSTNVADVPGLTKDDADTLAGRSMLVRKAEPLPIECVARGYLSGSGWKDYVATGEVCGIPLPEGLLESSQLPEPIFTPATKAQSGHDINISVDDAGTLVDPDVLDRARELTLQLYAEGAAHAESVGIIVADTKFEFGLLPEDGRPAAGSPDPDRRSADTRLVAILARRYLRPRRIATELRQTVRPRLSRTDQVEQATARAVVARRRGHEDAREVCRGVSTAHRPRTGVNPGRRGKRP